MEDLNNDEIILVSGVIAVFLCFFCTVCMILIVYVYHVHMRLKIYRKLIDKKLLEKEEDPLMGQINDKV